MTPRLVRPGMDRRRAFAVLMPKLWVIPAAAVLGALLGVLLYLALDLIRAPQPAYTLTRELYIDFAFNEKTKEAYDYYNAFTWNDIVHTDAILGKAAEKLPYEKERVSASAVVEMPSDIRLIHLQVEDTDPEAVGAIADALTEAIESFGADMREFERIYVIHPGEVKPVIRVKKTGRAAEAGAILGLIFGIVGLGLWYSLDDRILVPGDLAGYVNCPVVMERVSSGCAGLKRAGVGSASLKSEESAEMDEAVTEQKSSGYGNSKSDVEADAADDSRKGTSGKESSGSAGEAKDSVRKEAEGTDTAVIKQKSSGNASCDNAGKAEASGCNRAEDSRITASYANYMKIPAGTTIAALQLMLEEAAAAGKQYEGILLTGVDPKMISRYDTSLG